MNTRYLPKALILLLILSGLSGCGVTTLTNALPDTSTTHLVDIGETVAFSVEGPAPVDGPEGNDITYEWTVSKVGGNSPVYFTAANDVLSYEYVPQAGDEIYSIIKIVVTMSDGTQVGDIGVSKFRHYKRWEIKVGTDAQTPPEWVGSYYLQNNNDLDFIQQYSIITGDLSVNETTLKSLNDLKHISAVGGNVSISSNDSLSSFTGINLSRVEGNLYIGYNNILGNLSGLESIETIGGKLEITHNQRLLSLEGLNNLSAIGNRLYIVENNKLTSVSELSQLNSVGQDFRIRSNDSLCQNEAEALQAQVISGGGIGGVTAISSNKNCN